MVLLCKRRSIDGTEARPSEAVRPPRLWADQNFSYSTQMNPVVFKNNKHYRFE